MAIFPVIQSPCPYKGKLTDILDGDVCRLCDRKVHDLTAMSDGEKRAFLRSCGGEVCVSYAIPAAMLSASALAALGAAAPASAQTTGTLERIVVTGGGMTQPEKAAFFYLGPTDVSALVSDVSLAELAETSQVAAEEKAPEPKSQRRRKEDSPGPGRD